MSDEKGQTLEEKKGREAAEEASALDKLTDRVEEKELDASKVQQAMTNIGVTQKAELAAQQQREKALASVKIRQEEVDIIASEFEVDKKKATRALRENRGDLLAALQSFL